MRKIWVIYKTRTRIKISKMKKLFSKNIDFNNDWQVDYWWVFLFLFLWNIFKTWRCEAAAETEEQAGWHWHTADEREHRTFVSHDVCEALRSRKKEDGGDRELTFNTWWYCDDSCFFTLEKHAIGNTQNHRAATRRQAGGLQTEATWTPHTDYIQFEPWEEELWGLWVSSSSRVTVKTSTGSFRSRVSCSWTSCLAKSSRRTGNHGSFLLAATVPEQGPRPGFLEEAGLSVQTIYPGQKSGPGSRRIQEDPEPC